MKWVMVFGTFDVVHPGHIKFLQQAKNQGQKLIVVIARDCNVIKIKNRKPKNSEEIRKQNIKKIKFVDRVVLGSKKDPYKIIKRYQPEAICLGYDQRVFVDKLKKNYRRVNKKIKIIRLRAYKSHLFKSSKLRARPILLATKNKNKEKEYKQLLKDYYQVFSLDDLGIIDDYNEQADNLLDNAVGKAKYFGERTGMLCLGDDTGLFVKALNGKPGVRSKRLAGKNKTAIQIVNFLLEKMKDVDKKKRAANFKCALCLYDPISGKIRKGLGSISGIITEKAIKGRRNFCYDSIFYLKNKRMTLSQLSRKEKNKISHRRLAFDKVMLKYNQKGNNY